MKARRFDLVLLPTLVQTGKGWELKKNWELFLVDSVNKAGIVQKIAPLWAYKDMRAKGSYQTIMARYVADPDRDYHILSRENMDTEAAARFVSSRNKFPTVEAAKKALSWMVQ